VFIVYKVFGHITATGCPKTTNCVAVVSAGLPTSYFSFNPTYFSPIICVKFDRIYLGYLSPHKIEEPSHKISKL
jgi:hypothetical protein